MTVASVATRFDNAGQLDSCVGEAFCEATCSLPGIIFGISGIASHYWHQRFFNPFDIENTQRVRQANCGNVVIHQCTQNVQLGIGEGDFAIQYLEIAGQTPVVSDLG